METNKNKGNYDYKHLTLESRNLIESCLNDGYKLVKISKLVEKDPRTNL